jgi:putative membrane protein
LEQVIVFNGNNLFNFSPIYSTIFVISLSISNIFLEFIPSTFLGCPDTETQLSILPAHELLKQGRAYEAVKLTSMGAITGTVLLMIFFPLFYFFLIKFYPFISKFIFFVLLGIFLVLLTKEKNKFFSFHFFNFWNFRNIYLKHFNNRTTLSFILQAYLGFHL